jgi:hypothetical protein
LRKFIYLFDGIRQLIPMLYLYKKKKGVVSLALYFRNNEIVKCIPSQINYHGEYFQ